MAIAPSRRRDDSRSSTNFVNHAAVACGLYSSTEGARTRMTARCTWSSRRSSTVAMAKPRFVWMMPLAAPVASASTAALSGGSGISAGPSLLAEDFFAHQLLDGEILEPLCGSGAGDRLGDPGEWVAMAADLQPGLIGPHRNAVAIDDRGCRLGKRQRDPRRGARAKRDDHNQEQDPAPQGEPYYTTLRSGCRAPVAKRLGAKAA